MSNVPSGFSYIQIESLEFRRPTSQDVFQAMGSSINGLLDFRTSQIAQNATFTAQIQSIVNYLVPVGSIMQSMLTGPELDTQIGLISPVGTEWILADGRDVTGSAYHTVSNRDHVPDLRGYFLRGKDNGGGHNPDGDLPLGTLQADGIRSHTHTATATSTIDISTANLTGSNNTLDVAEGHEKYNSDPRLVSLTQPAHTDVTIQSTGGNETRPANVTVNFFIRIN